MKVGDKVSVIAETISGCIIKMSDSEILIEDLDGFHRKYNINELVVQEGNYNLAEETLSKEIQKKIKLQVSSDQALKHYEIDLHIEELIETHQHLTNHEILSKQMTACRSFIQKALENNSNKVVLIHGKGEGVLKAEIHLYLNKLRNLNGILLQYHEAPYARYGMGGATEVIFT
jgi:DNA-nicking Smr family endonuclease